MSTLWLMLQGWQEVVCTFRAEEFGRALQALQDAGIDIRTRTTHCGSTTRRSGMLGAFGELPEHSIEYQIFVRKVAVPKAKLALTGRLTPGAEGHPQAE